MATCRVPGVVLAGAMGMSLLAAGCGTQATPTMVAATPAASQPVYAVPHVKGLVVDGRADDWGAGGFRVDAMVDAGSGRVRSAADFDPRFRLAWDEQGLIVLVEVDDDMPDESADDKTLYERDSVELFVATTQDSPRVVQVIVAPGMDPQHPELRCRIYDHRADGAVKLRQLPPTAARMARTATKHGYILEMLLPWTTLGLAPQVGDEVGFQTFFNDSDGGRRTKAMWYPVDGAPWNSACAYRLRLSETASPAIRVACDGADERLRRVRVGVVATGELAGHTVTVNDGAKQLGRGVLMADGRRARVEVVCPMPDPDKAYGPLTVLLDGKAAGSVTVPDPRPARREAFEGAAMCFTPSCVFSGTALPTAEFEQPSLIEDLVGEYSLRTDYYAADFAPVKTAEKPGRYGAVVTITTASGMVHKRYLTLFRRPDGLVVEAPLPQGAMPEGIITSLRIDPQVIEEQSASVVDGLMSAFYKAAKGDASIHSPAVFLAGLYETKPGELPVMRNREWYKNGAWWFELKRRTGDFKICPHKVRLPKTYDADATARHPLILLMGGMQSTPGDTSFSNSDIDTFADTHPDFPFIVVSPKGWWRSTWGPKEMGALLDDLLVRYRIDPDRVYVTGASIGGNQTWAWALDQPERFAAIVPLCSFMDTADAERLKDMPIWVFHGDADAAVPVRVSHEIEAALKQAGGKPKLTIYPGVNHNSWSRTYANPELYAWLLQQRRSHAAK